MSVTNGQVANATTFNTAFASKSQNNTLTGVQTLSNGGSGASVANVQQAINDLISDVATAGALKVEYRTISGGEATAKQLTLSETPNDGGEVAVDLIGGSAQFYGDDFTVSGTTLSWNGLALDGVLSAGDKIRIMYAY